MTGAPVAGLTARTVRRWVSAIVDREHGGAASVSVTFVEADPMQQLNRERFGKDAPTDVIAFRLEHPDALVGDIYVCPAVARRQAGELGVPPAEELRRLVVHGVLHVLGHDHPAGDERTQSPMWRLQEAYVTQLAEGVEG